jgi:hypothetical protein
VRTLLVAFLLVATLAGCATQPIVIAYGAPGFLMGIVHGLVVPFSLIGSIFMDIRIYAFPNAGGWYDFGFFLGAAASLGLVGGAANA